MSIKSKKLTVFQWNCRSISVNLLQFQSYIEENDFCILALQSLRVDSSKLPKLQNYYFPPLYSCDKITKKVQSAIYIRRDLSYSQVTPIPIPSTADDIYFSSACVKVNSNCVMNIISVYLPSGPKDDNTDWLKTFSVSNGNWVILGDFNSHSPLWERDCKIATCNRLVENIVDSDLVLLNDGHVTRIPDVANQRPTAIDLSLVSPSVAIESDWNVEENCLGSDHLPILISLNEQVKNEENEVEDQIPKFCYNRADWDSYQQFLLSRDISSIEHNDLDIFYSNFTSAVLSAAEYSIPKIKTNVHSKHKGNVWWNSSCADAVAEKKQCFKTWIRQRTDDNFISMKKAKLHCNKVIAQAKKLYWDDYCRNKVSESRDICNVWKKVKEMKNGCNFQSYSVKINNNAFPSAADKAKAFLDLFTKNSLSSSLQPSILAQRKEEERKSIYSDPVPVQDHYLNSVFTYEEFFEALMSFKSNTTAVGLDAISYQMLTHLPDTWKRLLHTFCQRTWQNGTIPSIWRKSVVVPILKEGKDRSSVDSYRPIALTSNVGKLMERIVLKRLLYHCEKNNVIPTNQAGFRKGRCTLDHLVKLSNNIKKQFARRKSCLATFFDVRKAYDRVWHQRLLYKVKEIGINGLMYDFIKSYLSERLICTRVGKLYSDFTKIDMGIPQGSILAPLLFSILIYDLPNSLSKTTSVLQYADDVSIYINASLRKHTSKRMVTYIQSLYQIELNKLSDYMQENGLELSGEKTSLILFNNGQNPQFLPKLYLDGILLTYQQSVKFLGVYFTSKLKWNLHIEHLLTKARKRLNLLKVIINQPWSQNTNTLLHLALSLIRSSLIYGQEVYFTASKYLLKKLQSIDSRALKMAIGVPVHTNTLKCYKEIGILPLCDQRKLATAKYAVRSLSVPNSVRDELLIDSERDYPLRAQNIPYLEPTNNYISEITSPCNVDLSSIQVVSSLSPLPPWEHICANFDVDYTEYKKSDNSNILVNEVKQHLQEKYSFHLKIFTDGSVTESQQCGSGFVIPDLGIKRSYYLGKGFSIFTSELYAILMAINHILWTPLSIFNVLFCVDSKSVLYALKSNNCKVRPELLAEIRYAIHCLKSIGVGVDFIWIPSHCGIYWNEVCDKLAKRGAEFGEDTFSYSDLSLSSHEIISLLQCRFTDTSIYRNRIMNDSPRHLTRLVYKLRLNSWKTKYVKDVKCICNSKITVKHVLQDCPVLKLLFQDKDIVHDHFSINDILYGSNVLGVASVLFQSPLYDSL